MSETISKPFAILLDRKESSGSTLNSSAFQKLKHLVKEEISNKTSDGAKEAPRAANVSFVPVGTSGSSAVSAAFAANLLVRTGLEVWGTFFPAG